MKEKSWASTYVEYAGYRVTVTDMGDGESEARLRELIEMLNSIGAKPWLDRNNLLSMEDKISEPSDKVKEDAFPDEPFEAAPIGDGSMYLGILLKKPKVAECPVGYSYEIVADAFSADEKEIRFYNEHADYPACTHNWKSDFGKEKFAEIFPGWTPQRGSKVKLTNPVKLYVKGEGTTSEGNAYQNLKSAEKA